MSQSKTISDPMAILGLPRDADEQAVRQRYLDLVKRYPPQSDPDRFREIQAAYQAAKDPLLIAERLLAPPDFDSPPSWGDVIDQEVKNPPALGVKFLLSLGDRDTSEVPSTKLDTDSESEHE